VMVPDNFMAHELGTPDQQLAEAMQVARMLESQGIRIGEGDDLSRFQPGPTDDQPHIRLPQPEDPEVPRDFDTPGVMDEPPIRIPRPPRDELPPIDTPSYYPTPSPIITPELKLPARTRNFTIAETDAAPLAPVQFQQDLNEEEEEQPDQNEDAESPYSDPPRQADEELDKVEDPDAERPNETFQEYIVIRGERIFIDEGVSRELAQIVEEEFKKRVLLTTGGWLACEKRVVYSIHISWTDKDLTIFKGAEQMACVEFLEAHSQDPDGPRGLLFPKISRNVNEGAVNAAVLHFLQSLGWECEAGCRLVVDILWMDYSLTVEYYIRYPNGDSGVICTVDQRNKHDLKAVIAITCLPEGS
jgi:hypothetical protein